MLLAGALLALAAGETSTAEAWFDRAEAAGCDIAPYLVTVAAQSLSQAMELLDSQQYAEAIDRLKHIEAEYGSADWFATNRQALAAARVTAKKGVLDAEADLLYAQAVKLHEANRLFDLRDLLNKLKAEYASSAAANDATRSPTLSELAGLVAGLGQKFTVRQDGSGDYTSIQAAIDAAPPKSLIEIQDNGPYNEKLLISEEKQGLTLRGVAGCWPIITSQGPNTNFPTLVSVKPSEVVLERLILAHGGAAGSASSCLAVPGEGPFHLRFVIGYCVNDNSWCGIGAVGNAVVENCVFASTLHAMLGRCEIRDTIALSRLHAKRASLNNVVCRTLESEGENDLQLCTIADPIRLPGAPSTLRDCILRSVEASRPGDRIDFCNLSGNPPFIDLAAPGNGCFFGDPQFVNPQKLDYRLLPTSPCIGKASDGGDIGCRFTPEMLQMFQLAFELRARGIIKF
jgi:hypothetical protein